MACIIRNINSHSMFSPDFWSANTANNEVHFLQTAAYKICLSNGNISYCHGFGFEKNVCTYKIAWFWYNAMYLTDMT